jgi:hypothetical protein
VCILTRQVGKLYYSALSEGELEIISEKKCELAFVERVLEDPELLPEVRLHSKDVVRKAPETRTSAAWRLRGARRARRRSVKS